MCNWFKKIWEFWVESPYPPVVELVYGPSISFKPMNQVAPVRSRLKASVLFVCAHPHCIA